MSGESLREAYSILHHLREEILQSSRDFNSFNFKELQEELLSDLSDVREDLPKQDVQGWVFSHPNVSWALWHR